MAMVYMWDTINGREWIENNLLNGKFKDRLIGVCVVDDSSVAESLVEDGLELGEDILTDWI